MKEGVRTKHSLKMFLKVFVAFTVLVVTIFICKAPNIAHAEGGTVNTHTAHVSDEKSFLRNFTDIEGEIEKDENFMLKYYSSGSEILKPFHDVAAKNIILDSDIKLSGTIEHYKPNMNAYNVRIYGDTYLDLNGHTLDMNGICFEIQYCGNYTLSIIDSSKEKSGKLLCGDNITFSVNRYRTSKTVYASDKDPSKEYVKTKTVYFDRTLVGIAIDGAKLVQTKTEGAHGQVFYTYGKEETKLIFRDAYFENFYYISNHVANLFDIHSLHVKNTKYLFNKDAYEEVNNLPRTDNDRGVVVGVKNGYVQNWFSWVAQLDDGVGGYNSFSVYRRAIPMDTIGTMDESQRAGELTLPVTLNLDAVADGPDTIKVISGSNILLSTDKEHWTGKINLTEMKRYGVWLKVKNKGLSQILTDEEETWEVTYDGYQIQKHWQFSIDPYRVTYIAPYDQLGKLEQKLDITDFTQPLPQPQFAPSYWGDEFLGWYKEPDFKTKWNFETDRATGDITLYAKYRGYGFKDDIQGTETFLNKTAKINLENVHNKKDLPVMLQVKDNNGTYSDVADVKGLSEYEIAPFDTVTEKTYRLKIEEQLSNEFTVKWVKDKDAPNDDGTYNIKVVNVETREADGVVYNQKGEVITKAHPGEIVTAKANLISPDVKPQEHLLGFICWQGWLEDLNIQEPDGTRSPTITFKMPNRHLELDTTYKHIVFLERENCRTYASDGREIGGSTYFSKVTVKADETKGIFDHWEISSKEIEDLVKTEINNPEITFAMPSVTVDKVTFKAVYKRPIFTLTVIDGDIPDLNKIDGTENRYKAEAKMLFTVMAKKDNCIGWTADVEGVTFEKTLMGWNFTMPSSDMTITPIYEEAKPPVERTYSIYDLINCTADKREGLKAGDTVTLTANTIEGKVFDRWELTASIDGDIVILENTPTVSFKMPNKDITSIAAIYRDKPEENTDSENNISYRLDGEEENLLDAIFTEEEKEKIANGARHSYELHLENAETTISKVDKALINEKLGKNTVGIYLDINLMKTLDGKENKVSKTNSPVKITIDIPENLIKSGRTYSVIRIHDGEVEIIEGKFDKASNEFTFETDRFSSYALVYKDSNTAMTVALVVIALIVATAIAGGVIYYIRKKKAN